MIKLKCMSSYLNLFLKERGSKYLSFMSFNRNSDIYQLIDEEIPCLYSSKGDKKKITPEALGNIIKDLSNNIAKSSERLSIMKECNSSIEDILDIKNYIDNLKRVLENISFLRNIATECTFDYCDFEGLYGFID